MAKVWKTKSLEIKTQRKTLGKTLDRIENKDQTNSQRFFFSNDFSTLLKQTKDQIFKALKHF